MWLLLLCVMCGVHLGGAVALEPVVVLLAVGSVVVLPAARHACRCEISCCVP